MARAYPHGLEVNGGQTRLVPSNESEIVREVDSSIYCVWLLTTRNEAAVAKQQCVLRATCASSARLASTRRSKTGFGMLV
jgi:hypothetical protein